MTKQRERTKKLGSMVDLILSRQAEGQDPGYASSMLKDIVSAELKRMEADTGLGLDEIADHWQSILEEKP